MLETDRTLDIGNPRYEQERCELASHLHAAEILIEDHWATDNYPGIIHMPGTDQRRRIQVITWVLMIAITRGMDMRRQFDVSEMCWDSPTILIPDESLAGYKQAS